MNFRALLCILNLICLVQEPRSPFLSLPPSLPLSLSLFLSLSLSVSPSLFPFSRETREGFPRSEFGEDRRRCPTTSRSRDEPHDYEFVTRSRGQHADRKRRNDARPSPSRLAATSAGAPSSVPVLEHFRRFQMIEHSSRALHRDGNKAGSVGIAR